MLVCATTACQNTRVSDLRAVQCQKFDQLPNPVATASLSSGRMSRTTSRRENTRDPIFDEVLVFTLPEPQSDVLDIRVCT